MRAVTLLVLLPALAGCATGTLRGADAEVSAAPAEGGVRVRFRRLGGADPDRPPELRADGGTIDEVVVSPDLKAISALWRDPRGNLSCRFPYAGSAVFEAGGTVDPATVAYVFLESQGVRVTAALPRGCLLLPALPLLVEVPEALGPVRLVLPDGRSLPPGDHGLVLLPLTSDERHVLRRGDLPVAIETAEGPIEFLIGIDEDGTPAAVTGYLGTGEASGEDIDAPGDR